MMNKPCIAGVCKSYHTIIQFLYKIRDLLYSNAYVCFFKTERNLKDRLYGLQLQVRDFILFSILIDAAHIILILALCLAFSSPLLLPKTKLRPG